MVNKKVFNDKVVIVKRDNDIVEIDAPNAKGVNIWSCPLLTKISVPKAREVEVCDCPNLELENINAPRAKIIINDKEVQHD